VTDDTTMALAMGESIVEDEKIDPVLIAEAFSLWLSNKPVDIGNTVRRGIIHYRYSLDPCVPESETDAGNGACMRCLPVILATYCANEHTKREAQRNQAHITHNNALSDAAIDCVTDMIHAIFDGADKNDLLHGPVAKLVSDYPEFNFRRKAMTNPTGYIVDTMQAVLQAFFDTDTFRDCLVDVVNRGGDADTTGAIVGMIAGAYYELKGIPGKWLNTLDSKTCYQCETQALDLIDYTFLASEGVYKKKPLSTGTSQGTLGVSA
jgi:ADP-ribosyl-[dinitrogen reductase] hydrolase